MYRDYLNSTLAADSTVAIADADRGYWYIGVYGFSACSFTIKAATSDGKQHFKIIGAALNVN
jgi:hypothetical protein